MFYVSVSDNARLTLNKNETLFTSTLTPAKTASKSPAAIAKLEDAELAKLEALPLYKEIVQACKNEIPYERERIPVPAAWLQEPTAVE